MSDEQMEAYQEFLAAKAYQSFAVRTRLQNITSTLKETHPMLEISPRDLDADCFLLCTPEATYDLRKGIAEPVSTLLMTLLQNHVRVTRQ